MNEKANRENRGEISIEFFLSGGLEGASGPCQHRGRKRFIFVIVTNVGRVKCPMNQRDKDSLGATRNKILEKKTKQHPSSLSLLS